MIWTLFRELIAMVLSHILLDGVMTAMGTFELKHRRVAAAVDVVKYCCKLMSRK